MRRTIKHSRARRSDEFVKNCVSRCAAHLMSLPDFANTTRQTQRDAHWRIERSQAARAAFKRAHPCPATQQPKGPCPGYVIDHVIALKRGGPDTPANMQWQTVDEAKAKDRVE